MADQVVKNILIEAQVRGLDQARAGIERLAAAQEKARAGGESMSRAQLNVGNAFDSLTKRYDDQARALDKVTQIYKQGALAVAAGKTSQAEVTRVAELAAGALLKHTNAANDNTATLSLNRMQVMELGHVARASIESIAASGLSFRVLTQEGARLGQALAEGNGGVGGSLKSIAGLALGIVTPFRLGAAAILATSAAAGIAFRQFDSQLDSMQVALSGRGRDSGLTVDSLNSLAERSAGPGGITFNAARGLATGYAGAGLRPDLIGGLTASTQKYARSTGESLTDAGKELAGMFVDPARGIDTFEAKLGNLDERTRLLITTQEREGNILGARETLYGAVNTRLSETADRTWAITRAWDAATSAASNYWAKLQHVTEAPTLNEKIDTAQRKLLAIPGDVGMYPPALQGQFRQRNDASRASASAGLNSLLAQRAKEASDALSKQRAADLNDLDKQADALIGRALPDLGQRSLLTAQRDTLSGAIGSRRDRDPNTLGFPTTDAVHALDAYNRALASGLSPLEKQQAEGRLMVDQIDAITVSQRANVAAEQTRLNLAGQHKDSATAELAVQQARLRVLEEAGNAAQDQLRTSQQQYALAGLSPFARGLAEIDQRHANFARTNDPAYVAPGTVSRSPLPPLGAMGASGDVASIIRSAALAHGVDPNIALAVARSEGLNSSPYAIGDNGTSFGPYQLHTGGGLGDVFKAQTGLPLDASTVTQQVNFALDQAVKGGWGPWHGWKGDPRAGLPGGASPSVNPSLGIGAANENSRQLDRAGYIKDQLTGFSSPLGSAQRDIDALNRSTANSATTWGQSAQAIATAGEKLKLTNDYIAQGIPPTAQLAAGIAATADKYGIAAKAAADLAKAQGQLVGAEDTVRGASSGFLGGLTSELIQGKKLSDALADSLKSVANTVLQRVEGNFVDSIFGKSGTVGNSDSLLGGWLTSTLKSLVPGFGNYGDDGVNLGSAASPLAGLDASDYGAGFSTGGYTGAGGKYDPAGLVHKGEYVMDAGTVARIGVPALNRMRGFADGGYVNDNAMIPSPRGFSRSGSGMAGGGSDQAPVFHIHSNSADPVKNVSTKRNSDGSFAVMMDHVYGSMQKRLADDSTNGRGTFGKMASAAGLSASRRFG